MITVSNNILVSRVWLCAGFVLAACYLSHLVLTIQFPNRQVSAHKFEELLSISRPFRDIEYVIESHDLADPSSYQSECVKLLFKLASEDCENCVLIPSCDVERIRNKLNRMGVTYVSYESSSLF